MVCLQQMRDSFNLLQRNKRNLNFMKNYPVNCFVHFTLHLKITLPLHHNVVKFVTVDFLLLICFQSPWQSSEKVSIWMKFQLPAAPSRITRKTGSLRIISRLQLQRNNVVGSLNHLPNYASTTLRDQILTTFHNRYVSVSMLHYVAFGSSSNWLNFGVTAS